MASEPQPPSAAPTPVSQPAPPPAPPPPTRAPGILSDEEQSKVRAWVVEKWGKGNADNLPHCPMCGEDNITWINPITMYTPMAMEGERTLSGGPIMPLLPVICSNCGHTVFVNGILAGILSTTGERLVKPVAEKTNG